MFERFTSDMVYTRYSLLSNVLTVKVHFMVVPLNLLSPP